MKKIQMKKIQLFKLMKMKMEAYFDETLEKIHLLKNEELERLQKKII